MITLTLTLTLGRALDYTRACDRSSYPTAPSVKATPTQP